MIPARRGARARASQGRGDRACNHQPDTGHDNRGANREQRRQRRTEAAADGAAGGEPLCRLVAFFQLQRGAGHGEMALPGFIRHHDVDVVGVVAVREAELVVGPAGRLGA